MAIRKVIAEIKLAPGQVGFYDPLTNIHLTITHPFGTVYSGMNTTNLIRSVKSKRLILLSGSLASSIIIKEAEAQKVVFTAKSSNEAEAAVEVKTKIEPKAKAVKEEVVETAEVEAVAMTEVAEEAVVEEVKEEAPKAKKKSSKKAKAETEEAGE